MNAPYRPNMARKIRSAAITSAASGMPCTLRIASFIVGHRCASDDTTVLCHVGGLGKGLSTKTTDMAGVFGCAHCHDLLDRRDARISYIEERYPLALTDRLLRSLIETHALLIDQGIIIIPDAKILK